MEGLVSEESILNTLLIHDDIIKVERHRFNTDLSSVRLLSKRSRLEEITAILNDLKTKLTLLETTKTKGITSKMVTENIKVYNLLCKTITNGLEQIRKEVEGDVLQIKGEIKLRTEDTIRGHITEVFSNETNLVFLVMAQMCKTYGINPLPIFQQLSSSHYSKQEKIESPRPPNEDIYDFNKLMKMVDENSSD